ncbi:MAG: hypothetical protein V7L23_15215 [Nostoc sp.]|uniref:hypothetical protein n=1 Tax=Nostoc sp. TaxID=1180 RepID=UPI002FEE7FC5
MSELTFPNLVLTFQKGTGEFTKDENGNPIEKSEDAIIYVVAKKRRYPEFYKLPGISTTDMQLEGKVVTQAKYGKSWIGASLPKFINLESEAQALLTFGDSAQRGIFRIIPTTQSKFVSISLAFGERIEGYLRVLSRN